MLLVEDGVVCIRTSYLIPGIKKLDECHVFHYAAAEGSGFQLGQGHYCNQGYLLLLSLHLSCILLFPNPTPHVPRT
jgi:hypothetical protein